MWEEIKNFMSSESTIVTKTTSANFTNVPINSDYKNVRYKMDCYILHKFSLVTILLFLITIICYLYAKYK